MRKAHVNIQTIFKPLPDRVAVRLLSINTIDINTIVQADVMKYHGDFRRSDQAIQRAGFTLLEIVLALAFLAGALAALGEVLRLARHSAAAARDETQAQLLAGSVMAELLAGSRPATAVSQASFDLPAEPPWVYSIQIEPTANEGLLLVRVQVQQQLPPEKQPAGCELVRWFVDPELISTAASAAESDEDSQSSGGGTSDGDSP